LSKEVTGQERSAIERLRQAIADGIAAEVRVAEGALLEAARSTGAADVWEAWAFLSAETSTAVDSAVRRERELIKQRLEALYADPNATWDDIIAVAVGSREDGAFDIAS
jgi:hypothetical protein